MGTAINQLIEISADEKMRELYRAKEKARLDMISKLKYAEKKGMEKGIEKGIEEGMEKGIEEGMEKGIEEGAINKAKEMATELIKDGVEVGLVVKYTKLTEDEVEKIKKKLNG